jgi:hypothetical protein
MANAPLSGRDGGGYKGDLGVRKTRIFLQKGWTGFRDGRPTGKSLPIKPAAPASITAVIARHLTGRLSIPPLSRHEFAAAACWITQL